MSESNGSPGVSIICPAFNEADGIGPAIGKLRDCLDRLSLPAEVLIINDGSTRNVDGRVVWPTCMPRIHSVCRSRPMR